MSDPKKVPGAVPVPMSCWWSLLGHDWSGEPEVSDKVHYHFVHWPRRWFPRYMTWTCRRCYRTKTRIIPMTVPPEEP